jgi:molybdenum cofactor synthesis domain-containing protein
VLTYYHALQRLLQVIRPLAAECLPLTTASGRTLATALVAPYPSPPFAQSLMDGYAVHSADTRSATAEHPVRLRLGRTLTAGETLPQPLPAHQAIRIMTGAPLPARADAVIKLEDGDVYAHHLVIRAPLSPGVHIQKRGAEVRRHTVILPAGEILTPQRIGCALSLGIDHAEVVRQPRIALVAPGDELLPPGAPLQPGKKWCSNLYALELRTQALGAASINLGIVPDTLEALTASLQRGLQGDVVVILGASGRGVHDFAARALATLGAEILCRGVAMSPGRGITVAHYQHTLIFGLPGSPWAAFVGFEAFITPVVRALLGQRPLSIAHAVLTTSVQVRRGVTHVMPTRLQSGTQGWEAVPLRDLLALARAEGAPLALLLVPPHRRQLPQGSWVRVQLL